MNTHLGKWIIILALLLLIIPVCGTEQEHINSYADPEDFPGPISNDTFPPEPDPIPGPIGGDSGWLKITSEPGGAQVFFDGNNIGKTPARVKVYTTGTPSHSVILELSGFKRWEREYHENPGDGETISVHARLIPDDCCFSMRITSAPSGAQISINGILMGYTPKTIGNLLPGTYQVTLSREGYETWHQPVQIGPDEKTSFYVVLEPLFAPITSGTLMLTTNPPGAKITVDQTIRGNTPRSLTLPEGPHSVTLNLEGYEQYTSGVYIRDNENTRLDISLVPEGNEKTPIIVTSSEIPKPTLANLEDLGDKAAGFLQRTGINPFLEEVNKPDGLLQQDGAYVTVLAVNGTLLADPFAASNISRNITSISDWNMVPYGFARMSVAKTGGGALYENDVSNGSQGGILLSSVRPVTDGLIITSSYPLKTSLPVIRPAELSMILSGEMQSGNSDMKRVGEISISIPEDVDSTGNADSEQESLLNQTDMNGITRLPVLKALALQGGGLCYITDPSGSEKITLAYITSMDEGMAMIRWISDKGAEKITTGNNVIHS